MTQSEQIREALDHELWFYADTKLVFSGEQVEVVRKAALELADLLDAATEPDYEKAGVGLAIIMADALALVIGKPVVIDEIHESWTNEARPVVDAAIESRLIDRREH